MRGLSEDLKSFSVSLSLDKRSIVILLAVLGDSSVALRDFSFEEERGGIFVALSIVVALERLLEDCVRKSSL